MMPYNSNKIPYGLKDGKLVHVNQVKNGLKCGCICPGCKAPLVANQGFMRSYFSHAPGFSHCVGAVESILHLMAKEIISDKKCMCFPSGGDLVGLVNFDRVEIEEWDEESGFRPDCIGYCKERTIWIEFKYTHPISFLKRKYIIEKKINCIEVDISECKLDYSEMELFITKRQDFRYWIKDETPVVHIKEMSNSMPSAKSFDFLDDSEDSADFSSDMNLPKKSDNVIRYAFDEDNNFVDVRKTGWKKKLFCLVCHNQLTPKGCVNCSCKERYLRKSAQELLFSRYNNLDQFNIEVQGNVKCENWNGCKYYDIEKCFGEQEQKFDIKTYGFKRLPVKDFEVPDSSIKLDLAFFSTSNAIIGIEICDNDDSYNSECSIPNIRLIKVKVEKLSDLDVLDVEPLSHRSHKFLGFSLQSSSGCKIKYTNKTFKVFYVLADGTTSYEDVHCSYLDTIRAKTKYYIIFRGGSSPNDKKYGLYRCKKLGINVCFCEICYYLACKGNCTYCIRHKAKGTPKFPLIEQPKQCDYFREDFNTTRELEQEYGSYDIEEKY